MVTALQIPVADGGRYPLSATRIVRLGADIPLRKSRRHYIDVSIRIGKLEYLYSETPISLRGPLVSMLGNRSFQPGNGSLDVGNHYIIYMIVRFCNKRFIVLYSVADKRHLPPSANRYLQRCNHLSINRLLPFCCSVADTCTLLNFIVVRKSTSISSKSIPK